MNTSVRIFNNGRKNLYERCIIKDVPAQTTDVCKYWSSCGLLGDRAAPYIDALVPGITRIKISNVSDLDMDFRIGNCHWKVTVKQPPPKLL